MKKGVSKVLKTLGILTIVFGFVVGVVVCLTQTTMIGLAWLAGIWFGSIVLGCVLMWMSEILDEQKKQSLLVKKIYKVISPDSDNSDKLSVGDEVSHIEYGAGTIEENTDCNVKVNFSEYGTIFFTMDDAKKYLEKI